MSEKEGKTPALSGEVIMDSVGIPKEEVNFNTPVPATHIIPSSYSYAPLLVQVSNLATNISLLSENGGIESNKDDATETIQLDKVGE